MESYIQYDQLSSWVETLLRFSWQAAESPNVINVGFVKQKGEGTENSQERGKKRK